MIYNELLKILFNEDTKEQVEQMFSSNSNLTNIQPIINSEFKLRLQKPTDQFINFEFLISSKSGLYFKPIALFNKTGKIILMNEFKETYLQIKSQLPNTSRTTFLTIQNNAVITAFSKEVFEYAHDILKEFKEFGIESKIDSGIFVSGLKRYDRYLNINNMHCELIFVTQIIHSFF